MPPRRKAGTAQPSPKRASIEADRYTLSNAFGAVRNLKNLKVERERKLKQSSTRFSKSLNEAKKRIEKLRHQHGSQRSTIVEQQSKRLADAVEKKVAAEAKMLEVMETLARDSEGLGILMIAVFSNLRDQAREYAENAANKKSQDMAIS